MAAGKSLVAKRLASKLRLKRYDLDNLIVAAHGPIDVLYSTEGEKAFRAYECEALRNIIENGEPGVIACGGGVVTHDPSWELLKTRTYRIFLKLPAGELFRRILRSKTVRPVAGANPSLARIRELLTSRQARYEDADLIVDCTRLTSSRVADRIAAWVRANEIAL